MGVVLLLLLAGYRFGYRKKGKWYWAFTSPDQRQRYDFDKLSRHVKDQQQDQDIKEVKLDVSRLLFYLKEPKDCADETIQRKYVRMGAGIRYVKNGGNCETAEHVIEYVRQNKDVYNMLTSEHPELRMEGV
jgi:hypothetical protein